MQAKLVGSQVFNLNPLPNKIELHYRRTNDNQSLGRVYWSLWVCLRLIIIYYNRHNALISLNVPAKTNNGGFQKINDCSLQQAHYGGDLKCAC